MAFVEKDLRIFESHVHLSSERYIDNFEEIVTYEPNFYYLNLATSLEESYIVSKQSQQVEGIFAAIGVHPLYLPVGRSDEEDLLSVTLRKLEDLILGNREKILAIGEIGLDFYRSSKEESYAIQLKWLKAQLELAKQYDLSVALHLRAANREALPILKEYSSLSLIIHSFDGTKEDLSSFLSLSESTFISFSPLIFRDLERYRALILLTPLSRILVESDAPYLAANSSICRSILRIISELKRHSFQEVRERVFQNSLKALKLNPMKV